MLTIDHSVDGSAKRWYWQAQRSPVTMDEREQGALHARFKFAIESVVPAELERAADECLSLGGQPPFDTEAADGIVCEDAGIVALPLGRDVLVIGRDVTRIIDGDTGRLSERKFELPKDYPFAQASQLYPELTDCGGGAMVLYSSIGVGFSPDRTSPPETRWWRRETDGTWSSEQSLEGRFAACGPTWTLLARATEAPTAAPYGHEQVWSLEAIGPYPYSIPQLPTGRGNCPHPLAPVSWLGFDSGDIFAAGPSCEQSHRMIVAQWRSASPQPTLTTVSGKYSVMPLSGGLSGASVRDVDVSLPGISSNRTWLAHFDGKRWHAPTVALNEWESLLAVAPSTRRGLGWYHVSSKVETRSGDVWLTVSQRQRDCGYCYMYDALLRVRSEARKKVPHT